MDTSEDVLGLGGGGDIGIPSVQAETRKKTAEVVDRGTEESKRRRARRQTSLLTRDFGAPQLGIPGLERVV